MYHIKLIMKYGAIMWALGFFGCMFTSGLISALLALIAATSSGAFLYCWWSYNWEDVKYERYRRCKREYR